LRVSTGGLAALQFQQGLALDPNAVNCRYGLTLADSLREFDTISILWSYVESFLEGYQPPSRAEPQTGQAFLDDLINLILQNAYFEAADEAIDQVEWLRANAPDVVYPLDTMPIILNFDVIADPHGDYDLPDAVSAEAWSGATAGIIKHVAALNLDFDLGLVFELTTIDFGMPFEELLGVLVDYLLRLFDNPLYPDFFTLKNNAADYKAAGLETGLGWLHAAETFKLIVAETSPQTNEVLGYDDLNNNQSWQENEPLIIPPWGPLPADENAAAWAFAKLFQQLANSFLDYTEYDTDPDNPQPFHLAYLNPVLEALGLPGLIPDLDFLIIDFGASYRDADPTGLRDTIVFILHILDLLLP
jgi:hypothetical protein